MSQLKSASLFDTRILVPAIGAAFKKLSPKSLIRNPVMFVVAVVSSLTTVLFVKDGKVQDQVVGAVPRAKLKEKLAALGV